jgi:formate dehydrogenase subunit delta
MSTDDKLVYMANQIAAFFAAQGHDKAVAGTADHIQKFWDPHMRQRFIAIAADRKAEMAPAVADAVPLIK